MNTLVKLFTNRPSPEQRLAGIIAGGLLLLMAFTVLSDYWFTLFQNSSFYISESLLFSSYWLLYLPFLILVQKLMRACRFSLKLGITAFAILAHLLVYPVLVWVLSDAFYAHTYDYQQTFRYGLSAYFVKSVLVYAFALFVLPILQIKTSSRTIPGEVGEEIKPTSFINSIRISDKNQAKFMLAVTDISYISANPPYVSLHLPTRKYLHTQTLKSLESQLDPGHFVRIHKSHIVNLGKISSWLSRHNGDYDLVLTDGTTLRVSRNYAKEFKSRIGQSTPVSPK